MERKICPARMKALTDAPEEGTFEALVSVFGNVDLAGDRVVKGAFADTLADWQRRGDPIPVLWSHNSVDPDYNIGSVQEASERDDGLWVRAGLDLEAPKARQVWRLLKGRRVTQFSFAYDVCRSAWVEEGGETVQELQKLTLHEVGPTQYGANPETALLAVKQAADRLASAARPAKAVPADVADELRAVMSAMSSMMGGSGGMSSTQADAIMARLRAILDGKARASQQGGDEEPAPAKSPEPARMSPATARLLADLAQAG